MRVLGFTIAKTINIYVTMSSVMTLVSHVSSKSAVNAKDTQTLTISETTW